MKITSKKVNGMIFYFIEETGIYSESFKELMKFLKAFKQEIKEYMASDCQYGFLFWMCGYSAPAQNDFRKAHPEIGC